MKRRCKHTPPKQKAYVIGHKSEEFCFLVPEIGCESADDQNLESAKRFDSLLGAIEASVDLSYSVFEIVVEQDVERVRELQVDLGLIERVPYPDCYYVRDSLLVGPTFATLSNEVTISRLARLAHAGVGVIISLCSRGELFQIGEVTYDLDLYELFNHHIFPVRDGGVPSKTMMRAVLDVIDNAIKGGENVFIHCAAGKGRSGTAIGCWLARHNIAVGYAALDRLAAIRYNYGLFAPSPENPKQCRFVMEWRPGL